MMFRLPESSRPDRYTLHLRIDPRTDRFRGRVEIELSVESRHRTLALHSVDLDIKSIRLEDRRGELPIRRWSLRPKRETLELRLARPIEPGTARLEIAYEGPIRSDLRGLYLARSGKRRYAVTQLEATDARRVFPCFDEPAMKARFRIEVTTPAKNRVISNAPEIRGERRGAWRTVEFAETPKLSTYLIAILVGEFVGSRARRCGRTPIRIWHVPGKEGLAAFALKAAVASLERLERYFALPYPYEKLDLIAVPDFEFGAMENAGAVTFRESLLLVDPKTVTLGEQKRVAEVMAHELAHMWYGDLVTMAWWDDLWLNEAFATWMAFTIVDDWRPDWQMWLDFEHHRAAAFSLDALQNTHPIYTEVQSPEEATENFDAITYEKGASVVRMVERWLGAGTFRKGVRQYIRRHREANARAQDLWEALEKASGRPVGPVVRSWIERPGFPLVQVQRTDQEGRATLDVRQERFFSSPLISAKETEEPWPIPMVVRSRPRRGRVQLTRELVRQSQTRITLGKAADVRWAYANADEGGFYRVAHDRGSLKEFLGDRARMAPVERVGLVGHQWAVLRAGRAELPDLLSIVSAYRDEPEAEALEALLGPIGFLKDPVAWVGGPKVEKALREWLSRSFGPALRELGWGRGREEDWLRLRRAALLRIVGGVAEDPEIQSEAEEWLQRYLRDRHVLDPNLAGPVVEISARRGGERLYASYLREMKRATTPQDRLRFAMALGAFRDPSLVQRTLELALGDQIPTQDVALLLARMLDAKHSRESTWEFVRNRWADISPRVPPGLASRLILALPALHTQARRREVRSFFRAHPIPTARRALKQALERFDLNLELRRRLVPALRGWLREQRSPVDA